MAKAVPLSEFRVNSARILEGLSETRGLSLIHISEPTRP